MRKGNVYYKEHHAGIILETNDGHYVFQYTKEYIENHTSDFITFSMPVVKKEYSSKQLFPFFEGLIPEGWLLDVATKSWKINPNDRMGLLLACCKNCIGAVSVIPIPEDDED